MKILVLPKPIEGVSREEMLRHAPAEIQAVWELYKQGIVREFYTRANEAGRVVLMLESASAEAARNALADAHLTVFSRGVIDDEKSTKAAQTSCGVMRHCQIS